MSIAWIYLDKKAAAIDALKDYSSMEYIIKNHQEDLEEVQERLTSIRSSHLTGMPSAHNPKAGENKLISCIDEIDVLKERYRQALEYMDWFKPAWDALNEEEQFVLSEFYRIEDARQTDAIGVISDRFHIERSSAYKKKNRTLERLAILLYGK
ncbi:hypothetical protein [Candidatus Soleaferrea massiliensis]|uniref:hypothetical protein n=1 Tax=Candidatus Soleaferrea massiliensis TaxID=1470354 RepID=UPI00059168F8|nr:hypothetical protein [Candidatus Soleaferrea massiliensis]